MEEKRLLGSQIEILARTLQNSEMAHREQKRVNEMILRELGIEEKDFEFWVFSNDLKTVKNQRPPKGDK